MPRIDATDRSISPLMMISVIGSVMIAISPLDRPRLNRLLLVRNCGEADAPTMPMITTTSARPVSQRARADASSRLTPGRRPRLSGDAGATDP